MNFTPKNQVMPTGPRYVSKTDFFESEKGLVAVHNMRFDGLVDIVKSMSNEGLHGSNEMRLAAVFPPGLPEHFCQIRGISWAEFWSDTKWIKEMLNDPMLSDFRVWKGRV
jgi:hypothetical protein